MVILLSVLLLLGSSAATGATESPTGVAAPTGLLCELLAKPELVRISDPTPHFCWVVNSSKPNDRQSAYQILVAKTQESLANDQGDLWDSGKVASANSINVGYGGKPLPAGGTCFWKVRTWDKDGQGSSWSAPQRFVMADQLSSGQTARYPLQTSETAPGRIVQKGPGSLFIDFGRAAFGYLRLQPDTRAEGYAITVHFGEKTKGPSEIDRAPGGTIRYASTSVAVESGRGTIEVHPPADQRNTSGAAIRLPASIGTVMPFRYVEIESSPVEITASMVRQGMVHYPFDDAAASFVSSDESLNRIWDLCKYTIKATTFCDVYVDGDRERIPYEADAYINQLSHYAVDREFALARYSHEYLLEHPTWPTEWKHHSILMAWADYLYTGNTESLRRNYATLQRKTLEERARPDGLLGSNPQQIKRDDIVDWPAGERDGFVHTPVNTVVNAFYYRTLVLMAEIAAALDKPEDAARYHKMAERVHRAFNETLFDLNRGIYVDGQGTDHASLHANMFALVFGLVPNPRRAKVLEFIKSRGMVCSVYGAQYLLEALYEAGEDEYAFDLMTAGGERGWLHMLELGSTMTLEAWDLKFKSNLDWNHAWGAAPANIIPRYVMGVRPVDPGFAQVLIHPQPGRLLSAKATIPTIRGPIGVEFAKDVKGVLELKVSIPVNMTARVGLDVIAGKTEAILDGRMVTGRREGITLWIEPVGSGTHVVRQG